MVEEGVQWDVETMRRMLNALVREAGEKLVCEHLGASEAEVRGLGSGIGEWTGERVAALEAICDLMNLGLGRRYTEVVYDDEDEDEDDSDADSAGEDGAVRRAFMR